MRARLLAVALGMVIVACGTAAGSGGSDPPPPAAGTVTVTRADNQRTVTAHVGDHIRIALGDDINWELEPPDGSVLVRESLRNYLLVRGTQAIWLAQSAGRSTITASGGMNCPSGAACPLMLALFTATVQVDP